MVTWGASKAPIKVSASYQEVYSFGDVEGVQPFQQGTAGERAIGKSAHAISNGHWMWWRDAGQESKQQHQEWVR